MLLAGQCRRNLPRFFFPWSNLGSNSEKFEEAGTKGGMRENEHISLHQDNDLGGEDEIPSVVSQSFHIDEGVRDKFLPFSSFSSGEKINHAVCLDCGSKNDCVADACQICGAHSFPLPAPELTISLFESLAPLVN